MMAAKIQSQFKEKSGRYEIESLEETKENWFSLKLFSKVDYTC